MDPTDFSRFFPLFANFFGQLLPSFAASCRFLLIFAAAFSRLEFDRICQPLFAANTAAIYRILRQIFAVFSRFLRPLL
jgi:hypothetical protein